MLHSDVKGRGKQGHLSRFYDFMVEPNLRTLFSHLNLSQRDPVFVNEKLKFLIGRLPTSKISSIKNPIS